MDNAEAWGAVESAIATARDGRPAVLVVEGEAGFGKTHLLRRIVAALGDFDVHRAFGEPETPDTPFHTLTELIARIDFTLTNSFQAVTVLLDYVDQAPAERPVAFVLDDVQWADADSVRALAGLLKRATGDGLLVVAAARPLGGAHGEWQRTLRDVSAEVVRLDGLSVEEVAGIVAMADDTAPPGLAAALREHTGGNPLHVISLLGEHTVADLVVMADADELPAPLELASHVEARVQDLSPEAADLLNALAVLGDGWVALETAGAVAGIEDPRGALRVLSAQGLVRARGESTSTVVRIFHAVLRAAVYEIIPTARRRDLHQRAADHVIEPGVRLRHRVAAASGAPDAALAADLVAFADALHTERQFREAARYLRLAASVTADAQARTDLSLDAEMEALLGAHPDASRELLRTGSPRDRLVVAYSLMTRGEWHAGWELLAPIGDADLRALPDRVAFRILSLRAQCSVGCDRPTAETFADIGAAERLTPDPAMLRNIHFAKMHITAWSVGEEEYWILGARGIPRAELAATLQGRARLAWRGIAHSMDGTVEEAIADLSTVTALVGEGGFDFTEGNYHALLGLAQFLSGDFARASASLDVALSNGIAHTHPASLAVSGLRELLGAPPAEARDGMAAVRAGFLRNRYRGALLIADAVQLLVLSLVEDDAVAAEWVRHRVNELGDPFDERIEYAPTLWLAMFAVAAGWSGDAALTRRWIARLEDQTIGPPWRPAMIAWLRARADTADGLDRTEEFVRLARDGFGSVPVLRLLVARDAASSAARHRHPRAAALREEAEALAASLDRFDRIVRRTDAAADARTDALATLSERERAVVDLVADGMSYAQIAKELYITRSTVGFHLSNCYAKTGTRSRHELAELARRARD